MDSEVAADLVSQFGRGFKEADVESACKKSLKPVLANSKRPVVKKTLYSNRTLNDCCKYSISKSEYLKHNGNILYLSKI
jgi:hypothetical protein